MPFVNGTNVKLSVNGVDLGQARNGTLALNNELPSSTTKSDLGWLTNIYGIRSATISIEAFSTYDESVNFNTLSELMLDRTSIRFQLPSEPGKSIIGICKIDSIEEIADMEQVVSYRLELVVNSILQDIVLEYLLLEDGFYLLQEDDGRVILNILNETNQSLLSFPLDEGNGNPNYIGFETGFFSLNDCTWVYDSTLNKNVINFPNTRNGLGDISGGTGQILFPSKYSISVDINVRNANSNFDTIFCTQNRRKVILIISKNGEILCTYDGSVTIGAQTSKNNFAQSFGTGLYSLNTWTNVKIIVDRTLGTVNCEVNGSPVGGTINPINGAMDNAYHKLELIGTALDSSFPKAFDGKMSNILITDLT